MNARKPAMAVLAVAVAACHEGEPRKRLDLAIEGPGSVVVTDGERRVCHGICSFALPARSELILELVPRGGAVIEHAAGPCESTAPCPIRLDADLSQSVVFRWQPLPPVTRYSSWHIDESFESAYQSVILKDLDGHGNAVGKIATLPPVFAFAPHVTYPVRFDAARATLDLLHGLPPTSLAVRATDDGLVVTDEGSFWQEGRAWSSGLLRGGVRDLSEHGWAVGSSQDEGAPSRAWVCDGATAAVWGGGTLDVTATAVDSAGRVFGTQQLDAGFSFGGVTVGWSVQIFPDSVVLLPISEPSYVTDVSDTGLVLGNLRSFGLSRGAYVHDLETGAVRVIEPPEGCESVWLDRIDPSGSVAVGTIHCYPGAEYPVVYYVAEERLVRLDTLVDFPPGWQLAQAVAANARGQILVWAYTMTGGPSLRGHFILTPE